MGCHSVFKPQNTESSLRAAAHRAARGVFSTFAQSITGPRMPTGGVDPGAFDSFHRVP